jgi:hypothetical protein
MPVRSNQFQRLVLEVHRGLGEGWEVQESRQLTDAVTGEPREVDIVAEREIHGYRIIISVEVCDRNRVADVIWVESLAKKHENLPTNMLALWSASGFTHAALKKAVALKLVVITPTDEAPWAAIAKKIRKSTVQLVRADLTTVVDVKLPDGSLARWSANPEMLLTDSDGRQCPLAQIQEFLKDNDQFRNVMLDNAPVGSGDFHAVFEPPRQYTVAGPTGVIGKVIRVLIGIRTNAQRSALEVRSALYNNQVTTLAETPWLGGIFRLVIREPKDGQPSSVATHSHSDE